MICFLFLATSLVQLRTRSFTAPSGSWRLSTGQSTDDIETQLVAMFGRLTDDLSVWQSLTSRFDADLFCGVFLVWQGHGFGMSPRLHRLLADRNLPIVFDIYASDGPDENAPVPEVMPPGTLMEQHGTRNHPS